MISCDARASSRRRLVQPASPCKRAINSAGRSISKETRRSFLPMTGTANVHQSASQPLRSCTSADQQANRIRTQQSAACNNRDATKPPNLREGRSSCHMQNLNRPSSFAIKHWRIRQFYARKEIETLIRKGIRTPPPPQPDHSVAIPIRHAFHIHWFHTVLASAAALLPRPEAPDDHSSACLDGGPDSAQQR